MLPMVTVEAVSPELMAFDLKMQILLETLRAAVAFSAEVSDALTEAKLMATVALQAIIEQTPTEATHATHD